MKYKDPERYKYFGDYLHRPDCKPNKDPTVKNPTYVAYTNLQSTVTVTYVVFSDLDTSIGKMSLRTCCTSDTNPWQLISATAAQYFKIIFKIVKMKDKLLNFNSCSDILAPILTKHHLDIKRMQM